MNHGHRHAGDARAQGVTGDLREEEYAGFIARGFQHEFDHINGLVFLDRVKDTRKLVTEKEYLRIIS